MNYYSPLNSSPSSPPPSPSIPHFYPPKFPIHNNCHHYRYNHVRHPLTSTVSCSLRRHHRRRRSPQKPKRPGPRSPSDEKLQMVIDIQNFSNKAPLSIRKILKSSELRFNEFVQSGNEAIADLTTLITADADQRVIISCRPSTLRFMGSLVLFSCVIAFSFRVLVKLGSGFSGRMGFGNNSRLVRRRDRSLGGREVVVASKRDTHDSDFRVLETPLAPVRATGLKSSEEMQKSGIRRMDEKKLPSWWPVSSTPPVLTAEKQKYQTIANRLIRAIMDYRIAGKDILEDDIIQFRRLCRTSGARVSIDTNNGRDSFYRASVHVVFDHCGRTENHSNSVEIDGEDARQFIAGLADNIGLENTRAARIVSAAVAARTRSCFLQAWALEMQGKHSEAVVELSKICLIHRIFPPEECSEVQYKPGCHLDTREFDELGGAMAAARKLEHLHFLYSSPEMEMVARGLEKHLKVGHREYLMDMLVGACGKGSCRSMAEALGLVPSRLQ